MSKRKYNVISVKPNKKCRIEQLNQNEEILKYFKQYDIKINKMMCQLKNEINICKTEIQKLKYIKTITDECSYIN